jgi:DNA topoisomerase-3
MPTFNRLFISEKKSAGESLGKYLAKSTGSPYEPSNSFAKIGNDYVVWMSGHLLELVDADHYNPEFVKWRLEHLPIIPSQFIVEPLRDPKYRAADKIQTIRRMVNDCTTVVGFGDPDAEGQLIQDEMLKFIGNKKPVLRLWCSSLNDAGLAKALSTLAPNQDYVGWYEAAMSRSHADWLYGINMTRACALHAQNVGADFKITIGRVQTPTLNLIVERELEIKRFKPLDYFIPYIGLVADPAFRADWMTIKADDGTYDDPRVDQEGRITDKAESDAIVASAKAAGNATVIHAETTAGTESAPLPFALSSLQSYCSKTYGLSAKATLDVAQSLYLKKLTTYPRVDCDYLPESQHSEATDILTSLSKASLPTVFGAAIRAAKPTFKSRVWNDAKVTVHHAIIPALLDNPADVASLSDVEAKVYFEIVKRYVLQFLPVAKFLATEVVLACGAQDAEEVYSVKGRRYTDDGWRKAFAIELADDGDEKDKSSSALLPSLTKGQVLQLREAGAAAKTTTSPKRYTDGTLITAMKQVHKYVKNPEYKKKLKESIGIGTEATRGAILETLLQRKFVTMKGKEFVPSDGAMQLMGALPDIMKTPDMTAMWQQINDDVKARKATYLDFIGKQKPWLTSLVKNSATFFTSQSFPSSGSSTPTKVCFGDIGQKGCGGSLRLINGKFGQFFGCTNPECKKTFRAVNGEPVEKESQATAAVENNPKYACQACQKGFLRRRERNDKTGYFWGCGNWTNGCKAIFSDLEGEPDFEGKSKRGGGSSGPSAAPGGSPVRKSRGRPSTYKAPTPTLR